MIAACSFPLHLRQSLGTILSPTSQCLHPSCLKLGFCLCVFLKARLLTAPDVYRPAWLRRWLLPSGDSSLPRAGKHPPEPPRCSLLHLPPLCRTSCSMLTASFPSPGTANSQICSTRKIKLNLIANYHRGHFLIVLCWERDSCCLVPCNLLCWIQLQPLEQSMADLKLGFPKTVVIYFFYLAAVRVNRLLHLWLSDPEHLSLHAVKEWVDIF